MTQAEQIVQEFDDSVPKLLQRDMLRSALACYQQSDKKAKRQYPPAVAMTMRGHFRNADMEVDLQNVAAKYVGVIANPEPNSMKSHYHTPVVVGNVKLTQSRISRPNKTVRPSAFREEYAAESAQLAFDFEPPKKRKVVGITKVAAIAEEKKYLFAILTHGYSKRDKSRPYFVHFSFPNSDCSRWLTQIDLLKRFPDVVTEFYAPIIAADDQQRRVKLRKGVKRGGKEKRA